MIVLDAGDDLRPGPAPVGRLVEVRAEVVALVTRRGDVEAALLGRVRLNAVDLRPLGQVRRRDVLPGLAGVAGDVDQAVVGAAPEDALLVRRLQGAEDRAVNLDAGVVLGDRAAGRALLGLVVARQVGADRLPTLASSVVLKRTLPPA